MTRIEYKIEFFDDDGTMHTLLLTEGMYLYDPLEVALAIKNGLVEAGIQARVIEVTITEGVPVE